MQLNKILQYIFYVLMCLPLLALGIYCFISLLKDIASINKAEKKVRDEKKRAKRERILEAEKKRLFYESLDRKRNG